MRLAQLKENDGQMLQGVLKNVKSLPLPQTHLSRDHFRSWTKFSEIFPSLSFFYYSAANQKRTEVSFLAWELLVWKRAAFLLKTELCCFIEKWRYHRAQGLLWCLYQWWDFRVGKTWEPFHFSKLGLAGNSLNSLSQGSHSPKLVLIYSVFWK